MQSINIIKKIAFTTNGGLCCNKVMPFGVKNAAATYQHLVNKIFRDQIGQTIEVYINDMINKSVHTMMMEDTVSLKGYT